MLGVNKLTFLSDILFTLIVSFLYPVHVSSFIIINKQPGMVVHACNPSSSGGRGRRISSLRPAQAKSVRPYLKNKIKTTGLGA
jgi:hypothetical protein